MTYQNHLVDPTFFYDAIEEFAFDYTVYIKQTPTIDDYGLQHSCFAKTTIRGSLQSQGLSLTMQTLKGNQYQKRYSFYCKSLYRISIGDIIEYKGNFYVVNEVQDFDEFGVRSCTLQLQDLYALRDFAEWQKYQNGVMTV